MSAARPAAGRRAALTTILVALIVAIPVVVFFWGRTSDSFAVKRVVVSGDQRLPRREVRRLLSSRFVGENLFTVGAGDVRSTLSRYPYVADVDVDRDFPDTLRIKLTEHQPAALLLANGAWYVLSSEGRVLAQLDAVGPGSASPPATSAGAAAGPTPATSATSTAAPDDGSDGSATASPTSAVGGSAPPAADPSGSVPSPAPSAGTERIGPLPVPPRRIVPRGMHGLPLMRTDSGTIAVGEPVDDQRVSDGLTLLAALPTVLVRRVAAVVVGATSAKAFLRDGLVVEFGTVDELDTKVLALQAVIERYRQRRVRPTLVDVSVPGRPLGAPILPTPATR